MSRSKSKQEEALQLLDDLDSFTPIPDSNTPANTNSKAGVPAGNEGDAEVLAFLDEITQKSAEPTKSTTAHIDRPLSRAGTPTLRKSTERVKLGGSSLAPGTTSTIRAATPPNAGASTSAPAESTSAPAAGGGGWGWGSVWNTASAALQQARTVVDEQVKNLPNNEQAKKWSEGVREYAKNANIDIDKIGQLSQDFRRVGLSTLTDILNVVAPPISEHEVILVWISHDMEGYDGVESLVYRSMARVMEQVQGGDLVVKNGTKKEDEKAAERPNDAARDLNAADSYESAVKLAQASLDLLIKALALEDPVPKSSSNPIEYSYIYLHIQPFFTSYVTPAASGETESLSAPPVQTKQQHLQFLVYLSDPQHKLVHSTISQAAPGAWLGIWDEYEWVEDLVAESLRVAIEVAAQEYVVSRMGWAKAEEGEKEKETQGEVKEKKTEYS